MLKGYHQACFVDLLEDENGNYSRSHNLSFVKIPPHFNTYEPYHKYIYVVRVDNKKVHHPDQVIPSYYHLDNYTSDHVIPGNGQSCPDTALLRKGQWFWWNNWDIPVGKTNTHILIGDHTIGRYDSTLDPFLYGGDIRIANIDGNIFLYNSDLSSVDIVLDIFKFDHYVLELSPVNISSKAYGKNFVLTDVKFVVNNLDSPCIIQYLDWFYEYGVRCKIDYHRIFEPGYIRGYYIGNNPTVAVDDNFSDNYEDFAVKNPFYFRGTGSSIENPNDGSINWGVTPLMSFGTPLVKYGDLYIGVGHLKIHSDPETHPYLPDSNIDKFRTYIAEYMNATYGDRYIQHFGTQTKNGRCQGYLYLIYFYILTCDYPFQHRFAPVKRWKSMHISDGYLPLSNKPIKDKDYDRDYKFSLYFPMGLELDGQNLIVSCGYGDYYSAFLEYDVDTVVAACKHDVSHLDFNSYQYHLDILAPVM